MSLHTCLAHYWQRGITHRLFPITSLVFVATVVNLLLVFVGSDYQSYLTSDMHGYWERATQIFSGDEKTPNTWVSNAPFYSRVIADIFTWLDYVYLREYALELLLILNVLWSAMATFALYGIGCRLLNNHTWALWLAGAFAFSYPNMYYNVFLLAEPFGIPFVITGLYLVMRWQHSWKIYAAGLIVGFGVGIRPSNGLIGLPIALYIFLHGFSFRKTPWRQWIPVLFPRGLKAAAFSVAFFSVIFMIVAENNRISDGKLRGITAHSGYNFFLGQSQTHMIVSSWDGLTYGFVPSSVADHPEYGTIRTNIPIYDSETYFAEGWKILEENPELWLEHFGKYKHLFFDNLFPAVPSVAGFSWLFDPFRYIYFYMLAFVGLLYITLRERDTAPANVALFGSIFVLCTAALYFFTVTFQYFTNFLYTLYVLTFLYLFSAIKHFTRYRRFIMRYVGVVVLATVAYLLYQPLKPLFIEPKIKVTVANNADPIFKLDQPLKIMDSDTFDVNNLEFNQALKLTHGSLGEYSDYEEWFSLTAETEFEIAESGLYMFTIYADDGYRLSINDETVMESNRLKKMNEGQIRTLKELEAGRHTLKVDLFQNGILVGLVGYYRRIEDSEGYPNLSDVRYNTRKGHGNFIGDSNEHVQFFYPSDSD